MLNRILFINAINIRSEVENRYKSLSFGYLAAVLRKEFGDNSFEYKIIDSDVENEINHFQPDIAGISCVSQNYNIAKKYATILKKHGIPVLIGGTHITALPKSLTDDMDIGVIGEGEKTIVELISLFQKEGGLPDKSKLAKVPGIVYEDNGQIKLTPPVEMISPLDEIPLPARDLLTIKETTYIFSSRGCPYRCKFCFSSRFWKKVRFFPAEYVIKEIKELVEVYKVKTIGFYDDLFIANKKRLRELAALIEKEGFNNKVEFSCIARANEVTPEIAQLLKEMNITSVSMGLESGNEKTLQYLKGDKITVKHNYEAVKILQNKGINVEGSFVIGSPHETKEDILETLDFIKKSGLYSFDVFLLTPFPGTPVWKTAKKENLVSDDMDWDKLNINFHENSEKAILLSKVLSREQIHELFLLFEKIRKKKALKILIKSLISQGVRNPAKVPGYLSRKLLR